MRRQALAVTVALLAVATFAQPASAQFGFAPGSVSLRLLDPSGQPDNRAGAHPDRLQIAFGFNSQGETVEGAVRDIVVDLPPGLLGSPTATPTCQRQVFDHALSRSEFCPEDSRVGTLALSSGFGQQELPLFNVEPAPGEFAAFGTSTGGKVLIQVHLRPQDLGATMEVRALVQDIPVSGGTIELWGIPADHQEETAIARRPLLVTPARCDAAPAVTLRAHSWEAPSEWSTATAVAAGPLQGCDQLPFQPATTFHLDNPFTDAPSGAAIDISLPTEDDPDGRISSELRSVSLALPPGLSVSPPGMNGLVACSDSQIAIGSEVPARCPGASRVGSVELVSPLLPVPLTGGVFFGLGTGADRFRIFVVATGPGVEAKFAGTMRLDPATGQMSAQFDDLPQVPLSKFHLSFDDGPSALLATPLTCGPAVAEASFQPWSGGGTIRNAATTTIGGACGVLPFHPSFRAGSSTAAAGRLAAFATTVEREDGEQPLSGLSMTFPPGLTASLRGVSRCSAAQLSAATCPPESRIGSSVVELGPGPRPVSLGGDTYLTGPFQGKPLGMAMVLGGRLGPFQIRGVVVRAGVGIDRRSGRLTFATERLPRVAGGIPLRIRGVGIEINRPGFIRNPSSCAPQTVAATIRSGAGAGMRASSPFRVTRCGALGFRPRISVSMQAPAADPRRPGLRIRLGSLSRGANLSSMRMLLPPVLAVQLGSLAELCSYRQALAGNCPRGSAVGAASAHTPLLGRRLTGSIFIAQPPGDGLPEFWIELGGAGIGFGIRARTARSDGRLETRLEDIPDIPLDRLSLRFAGGRRGVLASRRPLCDLPASGPTASFALLAHNYALRVERTAVVAKGC